MDPQSKLKGKTVGGKKLLSVLKLKWGLERENKSVPFRKKGEEK